MPGIIASTDVRPTDHCWQEHDFGRGWIRPTTGRRESVRIVVVGALGSGHTYFNDRCLPRWLRWRVQDLHTHPPSASVVEMEKSVAGRGRVLKGSER